VCRELRCQPVNSQSRLTDGCKSFILTAGPHLRLFSSTTCASTRPLLASSFRSAASSPWRTSAAARGLCWHTHARSQACNAAVLGARRTSLQSFHQRSSKSRSRLSARFAGGSLSGSDGFRSEDGTLALLKQCQ